LNTTFNDADKWTNQKIHKPRARRHSFFTTNEGELNFTDEVRKYNKGAVFTFQRTVEKTGIVTESRIDHILTNKEGRSPVTKTTVGEFGILPDHAPITCHINPTLST